MNILVFSWRDPKHPLAGGAEQVMHEHMKGWLEAGHQVTLFSSRIKGNPKKEEVLDEVKIIRKGIQFFGVQLSGFFYYLKNSKIFDLVIDEFHGLPFFTPFYVRKPKLAVIQEVAGKVWLKNDLPRPLNWIVGMVGYLGEPFLFLLYKKVPFISKKQTPFMTGSESARQSLVKVGISAQKITVIPHGIKIITPRPFPEKEKTKTIMYLGAITIDKGIDQALQVFSILNKKGKFNFWVAGRAGDKYINYLKRETIKLDISGRFKFFGFVDDKKKFELLARTHILINPSILEGWGLVNIEANSVGVPVVAYSSPGLIDSVKNGESGILVNENSPEKLAEAIIDILGDEERYKQLQAGALLWSKNFSWEKSKRKSLTLINKIVNRN